MASRFETVLDALRGVLSRRLFRLGLAAVSTLVLVGSVTGGLLAGILLLFVAVRGAGLGLEAIRRPIPPAEWARRRHALVEELRALAPEQREEAARNAGLDGDATPERLADWTIAGMQRRERLSRSRRELACEALGVIAFGVLIPLASVLHTSDLVSLRALGQGWTGTAVALSCIALYAWPHRWPATERRGARRSLWWSLPFLPAAGAVVAGITIHHSYLDPLRADRAKLRADRVLALRNNVLAGEHVDWVVGYAQALEQHGDPARALHYYRGALRLAPRHVEANARARALGGGQAEGTNGLPAKRDPRPWADSLGPEAFARLPYWSGVPSLESPPSCRLDRSLAHVDANTAVIVPVGEVPRSITVAIADVFRAELGLRVCLVQEPLALPTPGRFRGIVFGRQWSATSLAEVLLAKLGSIPDAPIRFLLVTGADLYFPDTDFVLSGTYDWGAVMSYARLERFGSGNPTLEHRAAKQALGALLKSYAVPISPDRNCVTSYSNGLSEFDAKGNRPNTETYARFRRQVEAEDRQWRARKLALPPGLPR